jgi:hypothetical protein
VHRIFFNEPKLEDKKQEKIDEELRTTKYDSIKYN